MSRNKVIMLKYIKDSIQHCLEMIRDSKDQKTRAYYVDYINKYIDQRNSVLGIK